MRTARLRAYVFVFAQRRFFLRCQTNPRNSAFEPRDAEEVAPLRTRTKSKGLSHGDRAWLALGQHLDTVVVPAEGSWVGMRIGPVETIRSLLRLITLPLTQRISPETYPGIHRALARL